MTSEPPQRPPVLGFLGFVGVWSLLWFLPVAALLLPVVPGGIATLLALYALSVLPLWPLARAFFGNAYPSRGMRLFVFRPFWYVQLLMPLAAAVALVATIVGVPFGAAGTAGRTALGGAVLGLVVLSIGGYLGSRRLVVRPLELAFPMLPDGFDGLRVVQLSDLHVGPHTSKRFLARVADRVVQAHPDLIVVTGDQVDDFTDDVLHFSAAFHALSAPHGVYGVAGNHDVYAGWPGVREGLERMGMRVLVNQAVPITRNGATIWLAGTGDPAAGPARVASRDRPAPDVDRTLSAVPADGFVLALAHNPALWPALVDRGVALTLSGHTHYGQLAIPRLGWSLVSPFLTYALGTYRVEPSVLYINPGTNHWGIPFRLGTPPEITLITLRRG